jgi:uncharacterized membrane protein YGL010W
MYVFCMHQILWEAIVLGGPLHREAESYHDLGYSFCLDNKPRNTQIQIGILIAVGIYYLGLDLYLGVEVKQMSYTQSWVSCDIIVAK